MKKRYTLILSAAVLAAAGTALGADTPITSWLFEPATPVAREVRQLFYLTMALVVPFLIGPQILLAYAIWKYRESRGHKPATFHENLKLEIIWTIVPVIVLIMMAVPMYKTLRKIDVPPKSDLVVEVIGHQFFWEYRFPKYGVGIANEPLVVPADKVVTLNCTSVDVIHSWWVPAFGVKQDANPGRITNAWFKADAGKYKGQCAELCGALHGEMYIDVKVLPEAEFEAWIKTKQAIPPDTAVKADSTKRTADIIIEGQNLNRHEQRIHS